MAIYKEGEKLMGCDDRTTTLFSTTVITSTVTVRPVGPHSEELRLAFDNDAVTTALKGV